MGKDEDDCGGYRTWNKVCLGLYMLDIVIGMNTLMQIKKSNGREPWQLLAINFVFLLANTSWFIVGNVWYYPTALVCNPSNPSIRPDLNPNQAAAIRNMLIWGYVVMRKCCACSCVYCVGLPILCWYVRR